MVFSYDHIGVDLQYFILVKFSVSLGNDKFTMPTVEILSFSVLLLQKTSLNYLPYLDAVCF